MSRQNADTYFIDSIRFSALTPYRASVPENGILKSGKSLWYVVENENIPEKMYLYGCKELTRYKNAHYYKRWEFNSPRNQNNTQPFALHSAIACITDILNSYRAISLWSLLEYYISSIKIIYLETGIDFANLTLPSLEQLTKYASHGRGSSPRQLLLFTQEYIYRYNKSTANWNTPITEKTYKELLNSGRLTIYVGSKGIQFKIYKKREKIRVELAIKGRAQVLRFLNPPFSQTSNRHITQLANLKATPFSALYLHFRPPPYRASGKNRHKSKNKSRFFLFLFLLPRKKRPYIYMQTDRRSMASE